MADRPNYTIIDWIFDEAEDKYPVFETPFTKRETVSEALQSLPHKSKNEVSKMIFDIRSEVTGRSLSEAIDTENVNWKNKFAAEIGKIKDTTDAEVAQERLDNERGSYEDESGEIVEAQLGEKIAELGEVIKKEVKKFGTIINKATTEADLDDIDLDDIEAKTNLATRNEIAELLKDKMGELFEKQKEFLAIPPGASEESEFREDIESRLGTGSVSSLRSLLEEVQRDAPTRRIEKLLSDRIEGRIGELEE